MELLPLLIFLAGIVYSAIASQKDKGKKEKRNIDPGKLNNPSKTNRRQTGSNKQDASKGFFEQVKSEIERSFGTFDENADKVPGQGQQQRQSGSSSQERPQYKRAERQSSSRPSVERSFGRSFEEKASESKTGRKVMDYYEDKTQTDRSKHKERAQRAKDSVFTEGFSRSDAEKRVKGIGRESVELSRYSLEADDLSKSSAESSAAQKERRAAALEKGDFSFDRKAVLNGIIFSEILGKPRSKR